MRTLNAIWFLLVLMTVGACTENDEPVQERGIGIDVMKTEAVSATVAFESYGGNPYLVSCLAADEYIQLGGDMGTIRNLSADPEWRSQLKSGRTEHAFTELRPETSYYAVAFEVTQQGDILNVLYKKEFTTLQKEEAGLNDVSFDLRVSEVTFESAVLDCVPSDPEAGYYLGVITAEEYAEWNVAEEGYDAYFFHLVDERKVSLDQDLRNGVCQCKFERLAGETAYRAFAFTVSASGTITSAVSETAFETEKSYFIDATFSLTATDVTRGSARINAVPSDDRVSYYYGIISKSEYETFASDFDLMEKIIQEKGAYFENFVVKGVDSYYEYGLTPGTAYYMLAFSYDKTTPTGYNSYLTKAEFVTLDQ